MPNQTTRKRRAHPLGTTYFQTLVTSLFSLPMFPYLPMNTMLFQLFLSHKINPKKEKIKILPTRCKQDKMNI
jgi:hypothetical protein